MDFDVTRTKGRFNEGLSQVLGLTSAYKYNQFKHKDLSCLPPQYCPRMQKPSTTGCGKNTKENLNFPSGVRSGISYQIRINFQEDDIATCNPHLV